MKPAAMGQISLAVFLAIVTGGVSACGKRLTDANLAEVRADMSMKEVESVLGQPSRVKSHELTLLTQMKTLPATRYYYEQDGQTVELIFVSDKLIGKNGNFEPGKGAAARLVEKSNAAEAASPGPKFPEPELPLRDLSGAESTLPEIDLMIPETPAPSETVEPPLPSETPQ